MLLQTAPCWFKVSQTLRIHRNEWQPIPITRNKQCHGQDGHLNEHKPYFTKLYFEQTPLHEAAVIYSFLALLFDNYKLHLWNCFHECTIKLVHIFPISTQVDLPITRHEIKPAFAKHLTDGKPHNLVRFSLLYVPDYTSEGASSSVPAYNHKGHDIISGAQFETLKAANDKIPKSLRTYVARGAGNVLTLSARRLTRTKEQKSSINTRRRRGFWLGCRNTLQVTEKPFSHSHLQIKDNTSPNTNWQPQNEASSNSGFFGIKRFNFFLQTNGFITSMPSTTDKVHVSLSLTCQAGALSHAITLLYWLRLKGSPARWPLCYSSRGSHEVTVLEMS